jgi:hypothetical protein
MCSHTSGRADVCLSDEHDRHFDGGGVAMERMVTICLSLDRARESTMILRSVVGAILAFAVAASPALACKGEEVFSDDFTDEGGPWGSAPWFKIAGGSAEIKMDPGFAGVAPFLGGTFKEFDVCVDITNPAVKTPESPPIAGIAFWFKDFQNMTSVLAAPIGAMIAIRNTKGRQLIATPARQVAALKTDAGAKNTLRVTAKGNNVTFYANDQRVANFRGVPDDAFIGLYGESERDQSTSWKFSNFKLTEAPK